MNVIFESMSHTACNLPICLKIKLFVWKNWDFSLYWMNLTWVDTMSLFHWSIELNENQSTGNERRKKTKYQDNSIERVSSENRSVFQQT